MKRFLFSFVVVLLAACGGTETAKNEYRLNPSGSVSSPVPVADLSALRVLPRTLTLKFDLTSGNISLKGGQFSSVLPTRFLEREQSDIWFELRNDASETLFEGGVTDPLAVPDEAEWAALYFGSSPSSQSSPQGEKKTRMEQASLNIRLPVRAGATKLVITRLHPEKKRLSVIDLSGIMNNAK
ncbi:MAG: hypothetical protein Q7S00_00900 [bacterium]|nr:hypothetical protein [bacterium]